MDNQFGRRSILLVDDVELFLELEKTFFHRDRFDLLMANNAQELMRLMETRKPDLVFIDMQLSGAQGDAVCRWIKQDKTLNAVPVVMVVAADDLDAESLCRQAGCDAMIHSPVKRQQLLSVAAEALGLVDRQQARIPARMLVHFGEVPDSLQSHYSINMSHGGMFVATQQVLPVGSSLSLLVEFPGEVQTFKWHGKVAWLNNSTTDKKTHLPTGMGIAFNAASALQQEQVKTYLVRNAA